MSKKEWIRHELPSLNDVESRPLLDEFVKAHTAGSEYEYEMRLQVPEWKEARFERGRMNYMLFHAADLGMQFARITGECAAGPIWSKDSEDVGILMQLARIDRAGAQKQTQLNDGGGVIVLLNQIPDGIIEVRHKLSSVQA